MEQNLLKMQELLTNEIINKQFNQEDFQSYAYERFPDKDELEKWNFDDLNLLVQQYQEQQKQKSDNQDEVVTPQQQLSHQINQQSQDQNTQEGMIETRPLVKRSRLIPKGLQKQIFLNVITKENALLKGFNEEEIKILDLIQQERSQIQFDKSIIFSEYETQIDCQMKKQYIEENVRLNFKVTIKNNKKLMFSNQIFCIETQPYNWKVERTKEDLQTLEKIMLNYFPEYSGYILQYDHKQDFHLHLENVLNIYYSKPKTRCLDYFLLFLNDDKAKELHMKPFSHYTQNEIKVQLKQQSSSSGHLKIEFNKQNLQGYKKLKKYQQEFYQNYRKFEIKFQESQQIIHQELEKMKYQLKVLKDSNQDILISDELTQKITGFNFNFFYDNIATTIQINNESKKFLSNTIDLISKKLDKTFKILEQPLVICSNQEQEIQRIYKNFVEEKKQWLNNKDIQQLLKKYGLNYESFSDYQYETISSILLDVFPLKVDINYEIIKKLKDKFAYLIQQVILEAQICLSELFKDLDLTCNNNFNELVQFINNSLKSNQKY